MPEEVIKIEKTAIKQGLLRQVAIEAHPHAFKVYLTICAYSKDNKVSQVGAKTLMDKTGLSRRIVFICIRSLEEIGFIKRLQEKKGCKQIYRLLDTE